MILLSERQKEQCYGCYSCLNTCPKKCIELTEDDEGFRYPQINKNICTNCDICEKACPIGKSAKELNKDLLDKPDTYTAYHLNEEARKRSQSGGLAFAISEYVINQGGIVFGCVLEKLGYPYHTMASKIEDVYPMCGSKYVQSDIDETYSQAKEQLEAEKLVLFTGTPCQIAGLYAFLRKSYDNLITCDLLCHGVPSRKVLMAYLEQLSTLKGKAVIKYQREKDKGFSSYVYCII